MRMKGYKTVVVNSAVAAIPVIDHVINNGAMLAPLLGPNGAAVMAILGIINVGLRVITDTPVGKGQK